MEGTATGLLPAPPRMQRQTLPIARAHPALEHGLTLATRTPAAYRLGKVRTVNPWTYAPHAPNEDADWRQASRPAPVWLKSLFARG